MSEFTPVSGAIRGFVENCPTPVAMFDRAMRYLAVSRSWSRDYQLESDDLIGRCHYEVFPEIGAEWREFHRRGLAGETLSRSEDPFPRKDGRTDYVDWQIHPWLEDGGAPGGILIYTQVVTDRVSARLQLKNEHERMRSLLEVATDVSIERTLKNALALGAKAFGLEIGILALTQGDQVYAHVTSGLDPQEAEKRVIRLEDSYAQLALTSDAPIALEHVGQSAYRDRPGYHRFRYETFLGAPIRLGLRQFGALCFFAREPRSSPFTAADKRFLALMASWLGSLLERDRLDRQNRSVIRGQREFFSVLAHDLKNQLGGSVMLVEYLAATVESLTEAEMKAVHAAEGQLTETRRMLEKLLAWGREVMVTNSPLRYAQIVFGPFAQELFAPFQVEAGQLGARLRTEGPAQLAFFGDPFLIQRILHNLVRNALNQLGTDGQVTVGAGIRDDEVCLSVQDNGPGLPAEVCTRLNEQDETILPSTNKSSGFGLLLCRTYAERHNGRLEFLPALGGGLRVEFSFPLLRSSGAEGPADPLDGLDNP